MLNVANFPHGCKLYWTVLSEALQVIAGPRTCLYITELSSPPKGGMTEACRAIWSHPSQSAFPNVTAKRPLHLHFCLSGCGALSVS